MLEIDFPFYADCQEAQSQTQMNADNPNGCHMSPAFVFVLSVYLLFGPDFGDVY